jgi:tetratricopeptide (TPR) repeat protein
LWAESYERDLQNILALQGEVGRAIAQEVSVQLTPQEKTRLAEVRSVNPGAYEEYLKGLFFWNKRTPEGLEKAIEHFQRANEIAPAYPPPYAYLADSYALQGKVKLAQETAEKALALDSELPEAHMALAGLGVDKDPEKRFKRALAVAPNLAILHHRYSVYLNLKRRYQEAVQEAQRARELDPLSLVINANLAGQLDSAGKYDEALAQAKRTIELDPNFPYGHSVLGEICVNQGRYDEAIAEFKTAQALGAYPAGIRGNLGYVYALSGKREEAQRIINELKVLSESNPSSFYALAVVYAGLKDKDRTLYWLKRSVIAGMAGPHLAATDRRLAVIHSDPRFQELLRIVESSR